MKEPENKYAMRDCIDEETDWLSLNPKERLLGTTKLWELYISLGGNADPEPDSDSPFYFKKTPR